MLWVQEIRRLERPREEEEQHLHRTLLYYRHFFRISFRGTWREGIIVLCRLFQGDSLLVVRGGESTYPRNATLRVLLLYYSRRRPTLEFLSSRQTCLLQHKRSKIH